MSNKDTVLDYLAGSLQKLQVQPLILNLGFLLKPKPITSPELCFNCEASFFIFIGVLTTFRPAVRRQRLCRRREDDPVFMREIN